MNKITQLLHTMHDVCRVGAQLANDNYEDIIIDPLLQAREDGDFDFQFTWDYGVSKLCIIVPDEDYVIKIPFTGYYDDESYESECRYRENHPEEFSDEPEYEEYYYEFYNAVLKTNTDPKEEWDYCKLETEIYSEACKENLSSYFAKEYLIGYINWHPVYAQQKATPLLSTDREYSIDPVTSKFIKDYCDSKDIFCFSPVWIQDFINYYGATEFERLSAFLDKMHISDLRPCNIGYINDTPILFDYTGFKEGE